MPANARSMSGLRRGRVADGAFRWHRYSRDRETGAAWHCFARISPEHIATCQGRRRSLDGSDAVREAQTMAHDPSNKHHGTFDYAVDHKNPGEGRTVTIDEFDTTN